MRNQDCVGFLQWCLPGLGLRWRGFRKVRGTVCKRVARRMRNLGLADVAGYRAFLATLSLVKTSSTNQLSLVKTSSTNQHPILCVRVRHHHSTENPRIRASDEVLTRDRSDG